MNARGARKDGKKDRWVNVDAVRWVLEDAGPVPAHQLSTLIVIAAHTSTEDGRGAFPSIETIAELTRKSERAVRRDVADLTCLGLLLPGDKKLVKHLRADKRPNVYDVPMRPRGDVHDRSSTTGRRRHDVHDLSSATERGDVHGSNGVTSTTPKQGLNKKRTTRATAAPAAAAAHCPECKRADGTGHTPGCLHDDPNDDS